VKVVPLFDETSPTDEHRHLHIGVVQQAKKPLSNLNFGYIAMGLIARFQRHVMKITGQADYTPTSCGSASTDIAWSRRNELKFVSPCIPQRCRYSRRSSRGVETPGGDVHESGGPVVIVECTPLPLKARAHYFRDGIEVMVPSVRRAAPDAINPRAKTHNYLNLLLGHQGFSDNRTHTAGVDKPSQRRNQVNKQDNQVAHRASPAITVRITRLEISTDCATDL